MCIRVSCELVWAISVYNTVQAWLVQSWMSYSVWCSISVLQCFTIIQLITYPLTSLILRYAINDVQAMYGLRCSFVNDWIQSHFSCLNPHFLTEKIFIYTLIVSFFLKSGEHIVISFSRLFCRRVSRISTVRYNWPMSAHASQAFSTAHCTDSEDLPR